jgi:hypothetical protein
MEPKALDYYGAYDPVDNCISMKNTINEYTQASCIFIHEITHSLETVHIGSEFGDDLTKSENIQKAFDNLYKNHSAVSKDQLSGFHPSYKVHSVPRLIKVMTRTPEGKLLYDNKVCTYHKLYNRCTENGSKGAVVDEYEIKIYYTNPKKGHTYDMRKAGKEFITRGCERAYVYFDESKKEIRDGVSKLNDKDLRFLCNEDYYHFIRHDIYTMAAAELAIRQYGSEYMEYFGDIMSGKKQFWESVDVTDLDKNEFKIKDTNKDYSKYV